MAVLHIPMYARHLGSHSKNGVLSGFHTSGLPILRSILLLKWCSVLLASSASCPDHLEFLGVAGLELVFAAS